MANYPDATPPFPSLHELQREFSDQAESDKFQNATTEFCQRQTLSVQELVGVALGHLHKCEPPGVEDLGKFMRSLIYIYHLDHRPESAELYEAVKGIPAHSGKRIGYTFQRRKSGDERGVFVFLQ